MVVCELLVGDNRVVVPLIIGAKGKAVRVRCCWPSHPCLHQYKVIMNHTLCRKPLGLSGLVNLLVLIFVMSPVSVDGLCVIFSFPSRQSVLSLDSSTLLHPLKTGVLAIFFETVVLGQVALLHF